jgi:hypothetical protein
MNFTRYLYITSLFLLMGTLVSACAQEPLIGQQDTHSLPPVQPTEAEEQLTDTSPSPALPGTTWMVTPLSTQPVSVIEPTKEGMMTTPVPQPVPQDPGVDELVRLAIRDLAERLNVSQDSIEVVQFEAVIWPDGSLGCSQPGLEYLQVQSEGYRIQLRHADRLYNYHGGGNLPPFLCER